MIKFEEYIGVEHDSYTNVWNNGVLSFWRTVTFVAASNHSLTRIRFAADRAWDSAPTGALNVYIYATDPVTNKPTGAPLSSGSIDCSVLDFNIPLPFNWFAVDVTLLALTAGIMYAIVFTAAVDVSVEVEEDDNPPYADGATWWSNDGGATWVLEGADNIEFEVWADVVSPTVQTLPATGVT